MPATSAPSLYSDCKAAVSHERFTMDTPVYVQRDEARASCAAAWQRVAELEATLDAVLWAGDLGLHGGDQARANCSTCKLVNDARALLARKPA